MHITSSSVGSICTFRAGSRGVVVESSRDLWVVSVIKYNVNYNKCLLPALLLALVLDLLVAFGVGVGVLK